MTGKTLAILIAAAVLLVLVRWLMPGDALPDTDALSDAPATQEEIPDAHPQSAAHLSYLDYLEQSKYLPPPPASLDGTEVDGSLEQDADGNLIVDVRVRWVFNYFLATLGEETLEQVKARLAAHIQASLSSDKAREQAWDLFERYLNAEQQVADTLSHDGSIDGMTQAIHDRNQLRAGWLGQEVADEFFGLEDAYDRHTLDVMSIQQSALSDEEKQARIEALQQQLPEALQEMAREVHAPAESAQAEQQLREQGASEHDIRQMREQQFGVEAADRLEQMEQTQAVWDQRYEQYRRELEQLDNSGLSADDRLEEIQRLRLNRFEQQELRRLEALDRIRAEP